MTAGIEVPLSPTARLLGVGEDPLMSEDWLHIVFGTGQAGNALAAYPAGQGIAVRALSRHRPPALADAGQGTGPGVHGHRALPAQQALQAFAQTVTDVDGF